MKRRRKEIRQNKETAKMFKCFTNDVFCTSFIVFVRELLMTSLVSKDVNNKSNDLVNKLLAEGEVVR